MRTRWQFGWPLFSRARLSSLFWRRDVSPPVFSRRLCARRFCAPFCEPALFWPRRVSRRAVSPSLFWRPLCAALFSPLCSPTFCAPLSRRFFSRLFSPPLCGPALFSLPVFSRRQLWTVSLSLFWRRRSLFSSAAA